MIHRSFSLLALAVVAAAALSACVSYGPQSLPKGANVDTAKKAMGVPTDESALPDGGRRLEYARGPFGRHTYLLDFNAQGELREWQQVLSEARFNTIHAGMDSSEVVALIGHSLEQRSIMFANQRVWAYRYETPFCQWFQVGINPQGKVVDTSYGPDPRCTVGDVSDRKR